MVLSIVISMRNILWSLLVLLSSAVALASPPKILYAKSNVIDYFDHNLLPLTFNAVVTDPDGIRDVIGGVLEDSSGKSYGVFTAPPNEGSYSISVSWDAINLVNPIFTGQRQFVLRFYDQAGEMATVQLPISFGSRRGFVCTGIARDLMKDVSTCGACDRNPESFAAANPLPAGYSYHSKLGWGMDPVCTGGKFGMFISGPASSRVSCQAHCAQFGQSCSTKEYGGAGAAFYRLASGEAKATDLKSCSDVPFPLYYSEKDSSFSGERCFCVEK